MDILSIGYLHLYLLSYRLPQCAPHNDRALASADRDLRTNVVRPVYTARIDSDHDFYLDHEFGFDGTRRELRLSPRQAKDIHLNGDYRFVGPLFCWYAGIRVD